MAMSLESVSRTEGRLRPGSGYRIRTPGGGSFGSALVWTLGLLVWIPGLLPGTGAESTRQDVVNTARCRVRCLSLLESNDDFSPFLSKYKTATSLHRCLEDANCTACMKPCSQPFISINLCERICEHDIATCGYSCKYLKQMYQNRPGTCPPESEAAGFDAACVAACGTDDECEGTAKCCANGCGSTCQAPLNQFDGMPDIPMGVSVRERPKGGTLELRWNPVESNHSSPVLYIIDSKWNVGRHHSETHMIPWQQIMQTTVTTAIFRDVTPGHWYQYRVAAVNLQGGRGVSAPSEPISLSGEPRAPSAPQNLTEGDTKIVEGHISVTVQWLPPRKSDLPITRYKVFWSKRLKNVTPTLARIKEHRKVLPGDQLYQELADLESDTTYFVQVQAICQYGDSRLKSDRASLYVHTFRLPRAAHQVAPTPMLVLPPLPTPGPVSSLVAHPPYFQKGLLKTNISWTAPSASEDEMGAELERVQIFWSPEVCIAGSLDDKMAISLSATSHEDYFVVFDLRFDCRYTVRVRSVSVDGTLGSESTISFRTPSCHGITVKGDVQPDCPTYVARVPEEPVNFQHVFLISGANITSRISWQEPQTDGSITGYRVVWGPSMSPHMAILDKNTALTKVLSKRQLEYTLTSLKEGTTYIVRLQALSTVGSGRVASVEFTTPWLQVTPADPHYRHLTPETNTKGRVETSTAEKRTTTTTATVVEIVPKEEHQQNVAKDNQNDTSPSSHPVYSFLLLIVPCVLLIEHTQRSH